MTRKFDPTKPVQTRDGRPARILSTDIKNRAYPLVAVILQPDGMEDVESFTSEGLWVSDGSEGEHDLLNLPPEVVREYFANVYPLTVGEAHHSARDANHHVGGVRLGLIKVTAYGDGTFDVEKVDISAGGPAASAIE